MATESVVSLEKNGPIARLTINRPEALNALNMIEAEHTRMRVLNQPSLEMTPT